MSTFGSTSLRFALPLAAFAVLAGCSHDTDNRTGYGNCNAAGCFGCVDETMKACWPLKYNPCDAADACTGGAVCTNIGCASSCKSNLDCRQGEACTTGGFCAPTGASVSPVDPGTTQKCSVDSPCGAGYLCESGTCTHATTCGLPVLCTADSECGSGRSCFQGSCHAACSASSGCPLGQACAAGKCVDAAPAIHQCVLDVDCGGSQRCINATCHPLCGADSQCGAGQFCDAGVCRADNRPKSASRG